MLNVSLNELVHFVIFLCPLRYIEKGIIEDNKSNDLVVLLLHYIIIVAIIKTLMFSEAPQINQINRSRQ